MRERRDDFRLGKRGPDSASPARFAPDDRADGPDWETPPLPPRRVKFPSSRIQIARWFYNSLIVLFLALMVGLLMYGHWIYENGG